MSNDEIIEIVEEEVEEVSLVESKSPDIKSSRDLAEYLSEGNTLSVELDAIKSAQSDMKAYLSLYARSQLKRIEKITRYLDLLEDKMMEDIDSYDPSQFIRAMNNLQTSLSNAIDLIKMVGTDDDYLNLFYTENNAFINSLQVNNRADIGLSRESRDKLRSIISKIQISGGSNEDKEDS